MSELHHHPALLNQEKLLFFLQEILDGVKSGDTLEGFIEFTLNPDLTNHCTETVWDVTARYRINNLQGQGGMRMVGAFTPSPPV